MNILHHKSWHVRTKTNMERVRRDERKAAEEEQRVLDRQIQAENERRINLLRAKADTRMEKMFGAFGAGSSHEKDVSISDASGHVNLFQDLEREERKNHGIGNKEYEAEKSAEKKEWESKMGIQVYFADNTNELSKKKEWYEELPVRISEGLKKERNWNPLPDLNTKRKSGEDNETASKRKRPHNEENCDDDSDDHGRKAKRHKKDKKKKKKKHRHRDSSEEKRLEEEYDKERKIKIERLRDERLKRERAEKARAYALLHPEDVEKTRKQEEEKEKRGKKKYNSQFNPEFFRK